MVGADYWTSARMRIWHGMTPDQRDYDRYQGVFPPGQGVCETEAGNVALAQWSEERHEELHRCACHANPPCSHCTECTECFTDGEAR